MSNAISHHENSNENYKKYHYTHTRMVELILFLIKKTNNSSVVKDGGFSYTSGGM